MNSIQFSEYMNHFKQTLKDLQSEDIKLVNGFIEGKADRNINYEKNIEYTYAVSSIRIQIDKLTQYGEKGFNV